MKITLKFAAWQEETSGVTRDAKRFEAENRKALENFFAHGKEDVDVCIFNEVTELDFQREMSDLELAVKYMLLDIKDDYSALQKKFRYTDKAAFALSLFETIVNERVGYNPHDGMTSYDTFYGRKGLHFRSYIPEAFLAETYHRKTPMRVNVADIPDEDLIKGVLIWYYNELAAWDREKLRNDADEMRYLRENWIESLILALA